MALKTRYSPLQHFTLDNVYTTFGEFSPRDKIIALISVGVAILLVLFLPLSLFSGKVSSLKKEVTVAQKGAKQIEDKIVDYQKSRVQLDEVEAKLGRVSGSLTSRVDAVAKQAGLTVDQLREKPPQELDFMEINSIEVKLAGVSLQQLIDFLQGIENDQSSLMRIRKIEIKTKYANRQMLEVSFELATFALKREG